MERQGFDPIDKGLLATVDFMEQMESTEELLKGDSKPKAKDGKKKSNKGSSNGKKKTPHCCKEHGPNCTHDTKDCRVLNSDKSKTGGSENKTWTRKAAESKDKSKKELAALIAKTVDKSVKKTLASANKKRKSSDSDDDNDCFLVDALTKDLDGFNYEDMEKLDVDDEDEVSV